MNIRWVQGLAEDLPAVAPGPYRLVTFGQSFHWTDEQPVAETVYDMLEPGGALALIVHTVTGRPRPGPGLPPIPHDEIKALVEKYLGTTRRAGRGTVPERTHCFEDVLGRTRFGVPQQFFVPGIPDLQRDTRASCPATCPSRPRRRTCLVIVIHLVGQIESHAVGVLVVENSDTFRQVCLRPDVTDRWLCVWGKGSTQDYTIAFLETMNDVPIAAWCDLDAYRVSIVTDLARRLKRAVTPVGMTVDLYASGTKSRPKDLADPQRVAEKMVAKAWRASGTSLRQSQHPVASAASKRLSMVKSFQ